MKTPKPKKIANRRVRLLRSKLEALAARGVDGERANAQKKLERLLARYDFIAPAVDIKDMFRGTFLPSHESRRLCTFPVQDQDIASAVKWAIENATGLRASFRGEAVHVEAASQSMTRLMSIATYITTGFRTLWERFERVPGVVASDRSLFLRGLYDGMMSDVRPEGISLPARRIEGTSQRAKRKALARAPGISVHPYSVALEMGKQIRFEAPLEDIVGSLEEKVGERKVLSEQAAT